MVLLKLLGQPALTWLLARFAFHLSPLLTGVAVVVAALPTGTGPYMLANIYHRDAAAIAGSILVSTVLSVVSIAVLVTLFRT
jgi:malonate transporter and related proteins